MKNENEIMHEIIELTARIEHEYPELYRYIDETPLTLDNATSKEISSADLENYLETLKKQLHEHIHLHTEHVET